MSPMDLFERVTEKMFKFKRQDFFKTNFASLMRINVIRKYAPLKHSNNSDVFNIIKGKINV